MEADPMADRDGDVHEDSSKAAAAAAAEGEGLQGDDMGRPVVAAAAAAVSGGMLQGTGAARDPAADLLVRPKGPPKRPELRHVGVPVFFHRTSFNSKFFPDCLNADKIKTRYCEVRALCITGCALGSGGFIHKLCVDTGSMCGGAGGRGGGGVYWREQHLPGGCAAERGCEVLACSCIVRCRAGGCGCGGVRGFER